MLDDIHSGNSNGAELEFCCKLVSVPRKRTKPASRIYVKKLARMLYTDGISSIASNILTYLVSIWLACAGSGGRWDVTGDTLRGGWGVCLAGKSGRLEPLESRTVVGVCGACWSWRVGGAGLIGRAVGAAGLVGYTVWANQMEVGLLIQSVPEEGKQRLQADQVGEQPSISSFREEDSWHFQAGQMEEGLSILFSPEKDEKRVQAEGSPAQFVLEGDNGYLQADQVGSRLPIRCVQEQDTHYWVPAETTLVGVNTPRACWTSSKGVDIQLPRADSMPQKASMKV